MGFIAYNNMVDRNATFSDIGGGMTNVANLGVPQHSVYASWTGDTAEFSANWGSTQDFRLVSLIAHDLAEGATITLKNLAGPTLATTTWGRFKNRPMNAYHLFSSDQSLSGIRVAISGAGTGTHKIGTLVASPVKEFDLLAGARWQPQSTALRNSVGATDWTVPGVRRRVVPITAIGTRAEVLGVSRDGTENSGDDFETILNTLGLHGFCVICPSHSADGTVIQAKIDALSIYGTLSSVGAPEHVEGETHRIRFDVMENR